jgi:PTH1 family peptidyl-tRNA hydrolase
MHFIVGLGNPGSEYAHTRHNVGFSLIERFVEREGLPSLHESSKHNGMISEGVFEGEEVTVFLPSTFMNVSGSAVKRFVLKEDIANMLVVYDDIDLPLGEYKVSFGRGDGGHNGVKSIIDGLGSKDFARLRVGIGKKSLWTGGLVRPKGEALAKYVLGSFSAKEQKVLEAVSDRFSEMVKVFVREGVERMMNRFN